MAERAQGQSEGGVSSPWRLVHTLTRNDRREVAAGED